MVRVTEAIEPIARRSAGAVERLSAMALRHAQILLNELPMQKVAVRRLERQQRGSTPQPFAGVQAAACGGQDA